MGSDNFDWNETTISQLRDLWNEVNPERPDHPLWSTSQIGDRVGCGKNAAIGKARRLDLPQRKSPIILDPNDPRRRARTKRIRRKPTLPSMAGPTTVILPPRIEPAPIAAAPKPPPVPKPPPAPPRFVYGRIITCCWPLGEPGTRAFRFCEEKSEPGKPYCSEHVRLAYVKVRDRREDEAA